MLFTGTAFRDALVAALEADTVLAALTDPALLISGPPVPLDSPEADVLEVGIQITDVTEWVTIGPPGPSQQQVAIQSSLRVIRPGNTNGSLTAAEERIETVFDRLFEVVRDDAAQSWVTGFGIYNRQVTERTYIPFAQHVESAAVWTAAVDFTVTYLARRN